MRNIAIITARSGSKGIIDKNIKVLNGKPLLAYSIDAALKSDLFDKVMVSTDSERYAQISREYGAEVPFLRSSENSGDASGSWDVVREVLKRYEESGERFDTVCLLQPTSPLRTAEDILGAYKELELKNADAITGVCECEHPIEFMMTLDDDKSLMDYRRNEPGLPRQMLPTYYRENGTIFIRKISYESEGIILRIDKEYAFVTSNASGIDIDTEDDFDYAEYLMQRAERHKMKKICFVTAARSEYGLLKWLMKEVDEASEFQLQLIVTGGHLLAEQGHTIDQIIADGFKVDAEVDAQLDLETKENIAASMGKMAEGMAHAFASLKPDYLVVLGDRYELLPICNTAFVMTIPIIHISGGDVTEGAIDDGIRNAVTMLETYHFPGTVDSAENIKRMRGSDKNIWAVGEPGLDSFNREELMDRNVLAGDLNLDLSCDWVLFTYHAETKKDLDYNLQVVRVCIEILESIPNIQVVVTYANADFGGNHINDYLESVSSEPNCNLRVVPSLGNKRYLSLMKQVSFVIGNSSSGIVEAPSLGVPVINIGERQKGRYFCSNVIQCNADESRIREAINVAHISGVDLSDSAYWGDGHASERIIEIIRKEL